MKKYIALLLCAILILSLCSCKKEVAAKKEITLLCCAEYLTEDLLKSFEKEYGITVKVEQLLSETEISEKLKADPTGYDLVIASDYTVNELRLLNLLQPMDRNKIENAKNLDPAYSNFYFDPKNEYTIPLNVAAVLVAYNKKTCPLKVKSYADLLNPKLKDQIVFLNSSNVLAGISNLYMGLDPISIEKLSELPAHLTAFAENTQSVHDYAAQEILASGKASVGVMFNPQIAEAIQKNKDLQLVYPEEGFILAADAIAYCSLDEPNISATQFVNYLLTDTVNAKMIQNLSGCPTIKGSAEKMDKAYASVTGNILDSAQIQNGHFFCKIAPEIQREFDNLYIESFREHLINLQMAYEAEEQAALEAEQAQQAEQAENQE